MFITVMFFQNSYVLAEDSVDSSNTNLKILRLDHVGITPEFQKNIKEYYFLADMSINKFEVTAVPENENATVKISGNTNIKEGLNTINIEVRSEDKTKTETYKIYVTKTRNKEHANSNLENLAIREGTLEPPFQPNITQYYVDIPNNVSKLDILAISESINASVSVEGNDKLAIGDNTITVNVTAEDEITKKKYVITAYRRSEQEDVQKEEERKEQQEQLEILLENDEAYTSTRLSSKAQGTVQNVNNMKTEDIVTFTLLGIVLIGFIVMIILNKINQK